MAGRGCILALAMLAACAATPSTPQRFAFVVEVGLSPRATAQLAATGGGLIVLASYYGVPKQAGQANPVSQVASESVLVPGAGAAHLTGAGLTREALDRLAGPPFVNVNVAAELSSPDNLLVCDYFDGPLARATAGPVLLRCALAEEKAEAQAKS
ncbi:MAG: hypothetical protein U1E34_01910 [Amaricoccus sp.]